MRIGLYFGSFNPIHNGHLAVAQYMLNSGIFDMVRFVVSPQNPFKKQDSLFDETLRLQWVKLAISDNAGFECSDAEFQLSKPSYTIHTVNHFIQQEAEHTFSIIIGSDNIHNIASWHSIEELCEKVDFHVYNRPGTAAEKLPDFGTFHWHNAPLMDISATYIRELLHNNKSIQYLVPDAVRLALQP